MKTAKPTFKTPAAPGLSDKGHAMGWTTFRDHTPSESRADIISREFTQAATANNPNAWGFESISTRGAIVYAIMYRDTPNQPRAYFGVVFITERKGGSFGYKDMGEDCGPHYYEAPLAMIDKLDKLAPNPGGYATGWRAAVRQHHARKAEKARAKREARANLARFISDHFQIIHIESKTCAR